MKKLNLSLAILICAVMAGNVVAAPTTNSTTPVGYVTHKVNAKSDQRIGLPMQRAPVFTVATITDLEKDALTALTTVNNAVVTASGITAPSGANYLVVTSGTANGKWEEIQSSTTGSVTLTASIPGFVSGNSFQIIPFWTLGTLLPDGGTTLLPNGGGIPASPDVYDALALVLFYNPAAVGVNIPSYKAYFYHGGSAGYAKGWYDNDDPDSGLKNAVVLSPEVGLTIRNGTASQISVPIIGTVPAGKMALDVVGRASGPQDNILYNKFPADVTLGNSGLAESGAVLPSTDVYDPGDQILMYPLEYSGFNGSASASYFYHGGSSGYAQGWYNSSDPDSGLQNSVVIFAGAQVLIRKTAGTSATVAWNPAIPYTLK